MRGSNGDISVRAELSSITALNANFNAGCSGQEEADAARDASGANFHVACADSHRPLRRAQPNSVRIRSISRGCPRVSVRGSRLRPQESARISACRTLRECHADQLVSTIDSCGMIHFFDTIRTTALVGIISFFVSIAGIGPFRRGSTPTQRYATRVL